MKNFWEFYPDKDYKSYKNYKAMFVIKDLLHWLSRYRLKLIVLFAAAVWGAVWVWPSSNLNLVFCSVGQGDASIVSRGFTQVLIDAGPSSPKAVDCLDRHLPFFDHHLEAAIISHPQADHFGGLPEVLSRFQVDKFVFNGFAGDSRSWADLSRLVEKEGSQIITLAAGGKLKLGEIEIDVLWPENKDYKNYKSYKSEPNNKILGVTSSRNLNADTLVLKLSYGGFSALFTGDIGEKEEKQMVKMATMAKMAENSNHSNRFNHSSHSSRFDILKVPHHGSKTSSSVEFLEAVRPALAVIEVGKNSYGHPADEVIKRLNSVGAEVLRTDRDGDVVVETDGKKWSVILPPCLGTFSKLSIPACRF